jgi:hypothetical protein
MAKATKKITKQSGDVVKSFSIALPIEKVIEGDNGELFVAGFLARTDIPDNTPRMPEQMNEALSAPHFTEWIGKMQEISKGKSLFNCREGHSTIMAGRGVEFKHIEGKGFWGKSEVVDPATKEKVRKGVITSHSIGGGYGQTWVEKGVLHYEAFPIEVSYVDVGMIPGTEFEYVKADGSAEMRKFASADEKENSMDGMSKAASFIGRFDAIKKDAGGYEVTADYAMQEAFDIQAGSRIVAEAAGLLVSERNEPAEAKLIAEIITAVTEWMAGEAKEAVGEKPVESPTNKPAAKVAPVEEIQNEESEEASAEEAKSETDEGGQSETDEGEDVSEEEAEEEADSENAPAGLTEADVEAIVRRVLAESENKNKSAKGELNKAQVAKMSSLEKSMTSLVSEVEKNFSLVADGMAKVNKAIASQAARNDAIEKKIDAYGPVVLSPRPSGQAAKASEVDEQSVLKMLIANTSNNPQLRQAYQARLTELEIRNAPALEAPPSFI